MSEIALDSAQLELPLEHYKVVKGNAFVEARYDWTTQMHRIIMMLIAQIRIDDIEFGTQHVYVRDLKALSETNSNTIYEDASEAASALLGQRIEIRRPNGEYHGYNLMSDVHYYPRSGLIEARFNPHMKPFLLQLKGAFTQYRLKQAMVLSSPYSIRFYELCCRWADIGWFDCTLDDLRTMFRLEDKYSRTVDLRRFVIDYSQRELKKKCDLYFDYTQVKEGRRIVAFKFRVIRKRQAPPSNPPPEAQTSPPLPHHPDDLDKELLEFEAALQAMSPAERDELEEAASQLLRRELPDFDAWSAAPKAGLLREKMRELWITRESKGIQS